MLNIEPNVFPSQPKIVPVAFIVANYDFSLNLLVVSDRQFEISTVATLIIRPIISHLFVCRNVEGVAGVNSDFFIFGSVIDSVLSQELKSTIILVFLEHSDNTLRERNAKFVALTVAKFNLVGCFEVNL